MAEEQEVIEYLKTLKEYLGQYKQEWIEKGTYKFYETFEINLETVLNILKEKDKEIKRKSSSVNALDCALYERTEERDRKDSIITRQNKQIDLMEEFIYLMWCDYPIKITKRLKDNGFDDKKCGTCESKEKTCLDCLEQYFKSKAEKEQK